MARDERDRTITSTDGILTDTQTDLQFWRNVSVDDTSTLSLLRIMRNKQLEVRVSEQEDVKVLYGPHFVCVRVSLSPQAETVLSRVAETAEYDALHEAFSTRAYQAEEWYLTNRCNMWGEKTRRRTTARFWLTQADANGHNADTADLDEETKNVYKEQERIARGKAKALLDQGENSSSLEPLSTDEVPKLMEDLVDKAIADLGKPAI